MPRSAAGTRSVAGRRLPSSLSGLYFGDTTANVNTANNASFNSLTAVTMEAWVYMTAKPKVAARIFEHQRTANKGYNLLVQANSQTLQNTVANNTTSVNNAGGTIPLNQWCHVAGTWDGSNIRTFVNGVLVAGPTALSGGNTSDDGNLPTIGNNANSGGNRGFPGFISEVRISNSARYTASFTPPTAPFTNDANTVGLWHFNEGSGLTANDSSSNSNTGTLGGAVLPIWVPGYFTGNLSARNVLPSYALYFPGGSGTGVVTVSNAAALKSLTAVTVEAWVFLPYTPSASVYLINYSASPKGYSFQIGSANNLIATVGNSTSQAQVNTGTVPRNQWVHLAMSWDGSTIREFINGVVQGTTNTLSGGNTGDPAMNAYIGNNSGGNRALGAIIQEMRISSTARYTASFTPSTTPFTNDANTVALYHFGDGSGTNITDSSSNGLTGTSSGTPSPAWVAGLLAGAGTPFTRTTA